jgi:ABC-type dipeptide/oligopeptide/nickel transport system ATPase subunit
MAKPKQSSPRSTFDLLSRGATMRDAVKESMAASSGKLKSDPGVMYDSLPSNANKMIPLADFGMQYLLNSKGLIGGRILDIIGADGVGKSTLVFTMLGWAMRHNIPSWYIETEGKPVVKERVVRCLHPDRAIAEKMFEALQFTQAFELTDAIDQLERWILTIRNPASGAAHVPLEIPCIAVLDTFSKLMAPAEAVAYDFYKKGGATTEEEAPKTAADKAKAKEKGKPKGKFRQKKEATKQELDGGSNMQHAKIAHKWTRRLPSLLTFNNCLLIIVRHQNEKVDMSGGGGSFIPLEVQDNFNRTSIGGKAFNQSCAYQLILSKEKFDFAQIRGERKAVAQINKMQLAKNSYGPNRRTLRYSVVMEPRYDTDTQHEMALDFSTGLPDVLSQTGLMSVRIKSASSIAVKELRLEDATPQQVSAALHQQPALVEDLGRRLQFAGYGSVNLETPELNPAFAPSKGEPKSE